MYSISIAFRLKNTGSTPAWDITRFICTDLYLEVCGVVFQTGTADNKSEIIPYLAANDEAVFFIVAPFWNHCGDRFDFEDNLFMTENAIIRFSAEACLDDIGTNSNPMVTRVIQVSGGNSWSGGESVWRKFPPLKADQESIDDGTLGSIGLVQMRVSGDWEEQKNTDPVGNQPISFNAKYS